MNGIQTAFVGRVASEAMELKTSTSGKAWAAFNVGVGSGDNVQWVRVAVFEDLAERLAGGLLEGDKVYVEGSLRLDRWSDKTCGQERSGLSCAAWRVEHLGQIGRRKRNRAGRSRAQEAAVDQQSPSGSWQQ